jgi:RNA polymerase subunit RPABC4/transcription elongation factor Spt4
MGSQVIASCDCGLQATILIGCGMLDFPNVCLFPAHCKHCKRVVEANLARKPVCCPDCGDADVTSYGDSAPIGADESDEVARWGELRLKDVPYLCPACERMTLRFSPSGLLWD